MVIFRHDGPPTGAHGQIHRAPSDNSEQAKKRTGKQATIAMLCHGVIEWRVKFHALPC